MFWVGLGWVGLVKGSVEYGYGYESSRSTGVSFWGVTDSDCDAGWGWGWVDGRWYCGEGEKDG